MGRHNYIWSTFLFDRHWSQHWSDTIIFGQHLYFIDIVANIGLTPEIDSTPKTCQTPPDIDGEGDSCNDDDDKRTEIDWMSNF